MVIDIVHWDDRTLVLALKGRCDFKSRHAYQSAMDQAFQSTPESVILDFTEVSYLDSAGLGLLALSHKKFSESAIAVIIAAPPEPIRQILQLANMGKIFPICESVTAAAQTAVSRG